MIDDDARRDRMPLPPVTPAAIRAGPAGAAPAASGQGPMLPPFMAGRTPPRWKVPFPPQWPHTPPGPATTRAAAEPAAEPAVEFAAESAAEFAAEPGAEAAAEPAVELAEGGIAEGPAGALATPPAAPEGSVAAPGGEPSVHSFMEPPAPQAPAPDASVARPSFDDRMPWEIDDVATPSTDVFVPGPFDPPPAPAAEPEPEPRAAPEPWEPWDPSQLWDEPPSHPPDQQQSLEYRDEAQHAADGSHAGPDVPAEPVTFEAIPLEIPVGDRWQQDVTERVAARLEELAREVRSRGIAALGAAENADELSRLIAGVIAGFLARDDHA
jgi:hypothetical protein